jgi:hypothetical protein
MKLNLIVELTAKLQRRMKMTIGVLCLIINVYRFCIFYKFIVKYYTYRVLDKNSCTPKVVWIPHRSFLKNYLPLEKKLDLLIGYKQDNICYRTQYKKPNDHVYSIKHLLELMEKNWVIERRRDKVKPLPSCKQNTLICICLLIVAALHIAISIIF